MGGEPSLRTSGDMGGCKIETSRAPFQVRASAQAGFQNRPPNLEATERKPPKIQSIFIIFIKFLHIY